jgi:tRNA nucleotidyltransferase (CCA-adding enzyme)
LNIALDEPAPRIAKAIAEAGGRALLVGGRVRDALLEIPSKDIDIEVFGLTLEELEDVLRRFGEITHVGRAFGVLRVKGVDVDFSLPRTDSKVGTGHRGFDVTYDPDMPFADAARRRDVTINSIGYDVLTGELLDPFGGRKDLDAKVLRATDPAHFSEDPLRALRVAGFAARFEMTPDAELERLCARLDLSELSVERILAELDKILLKAPFPSIAFEFLRTTNLLRFFPEIESMIDVPQDAEWHPEGDVFVHTMMVIDEAARLRRGDDDDPALMYGALCHDLGKPLTTEVIDGRIRSYNHDTEGVAVTETFLERLRAPAELTRKVCALVRHHLAPGLYQQNGAKPKAYRRLARDLEAAGASIELLLRVATADHFGRTTDDALARRFPAGDHFRGQVEALAIQDEAPKDVVLGRHLIARGMEPGKSFGDILERCREVQDEHGWTDPDQILDFVLAEGDSK